MYDDRTMIMNDDNWSGETLCLKKRPKTAEEKVGIFGYSAFGVITNSMAPFVIYLRGNDPDDDFRKTMTYESVDALIDDGWVVD